MQYYKNRNLAQELWCDIRADSGLIDYRQMTIITSLRSIQDQIVLPNSKEVVPTALNHLMFTTGEYMVGLANYARLFLTIIYSNSQFCAYNVF